jgi:hypothetical protein
LPHGRDILRGDGAVGIAELREHVIAHIGGLLVR